MCRWLYSPLSYLVDKVDINRLNLKSNYRMLSITLKKSVKYWISISIWTVGGTRVLEVINLRVFIELEYRVEGSCFTKKYHNSRASSMILGQKVWVAIIRRDMEIYKNMLYILFCLEQEFVF